MYRYIIFLAFASTLLLSCSRGSGQLENRLATNYEEFESAAYNLPSGNLYYLGSKLQRERLSDSLEHVIRVLFPEKASRDSLLAQVQTWLRDSIFISPSDSIEDQLVIYMNGFKGVSEGIDGPDAKNKPLTLGYKDQLLQLQNSSLTAHAAGKTVYFDLRPANEAWIDSMGHCTIEASGQHRYWAFQRTGSTRTRFDLRADYYTIDWYLTITSDDLFPQKGLALKVSDHTLVMQWP